MATDSPIDIHQLTMPHTGMDLVSLVWDKGSPWVEDIYRRSRGEYGDSADHFFVARADGQMVAIAWYCTATSNPKLQRSITRFHTSSSSNHHSPFDDGFSK